MIKTDEIKSVILLLYLSRMIEKNSIPKGFKIPHNVFIKLKTLAWKFLSIVVISIFCNGIFIMLIRKLMLIENTTIIEKNVILLNEKNKLVAKILRINPITVTARIDIFNGFFISFIKEIIIADTNNPIETAICVKAYR